MSTKSKGIRYHGAAIKPWMYHKKDSLIKEAWSILIEQPAIWRNTLKVSRLVRHAFNSGIELDLDLIPELELDLIPRIGMGIGIIFVRIELELIKRWN